ncbi:MAG TPA: protein phosphatase [Paracoccus sp.]|nr:protein phosphatase [Paracoccus sp. (in: a-proteobacteria)]
MRGAAYRFDILPLGKGQIGIGPLPGRSRDLAGDLAQLMRFGPGLVISLTGSDEMTLRGAGKLPARLACAGIPWAHFPITDFGLPDAATDAGWPALSARVQAGLAKGERVFVHCKAGLGRSGMVVLRLMIEAGEAPDAALARLRACRPGTVETAAQEDWARAGAGRGRGDMVKG